MPLGAVHDFAFYLCAAWLFLAPGIMVSVFSLSKWGGWVALTCRQALYAR